MITTSFADKAVFVTGAGLGIGFAVCHAFARAGAVVGLNDIDPDLAQRAAEQINTAVSAKRVFPFAFDVAEVTAVQQSIRAFTAARGGWTWWWPMPVLPNTVVFWTIRPRILIW